MLNLYNTTAGEAVTGTGESVPSSIQPCPAGNSESSGTDSVVDRLFNLISARAKTEVNLFDHPPRKKKNVRPPEFYIHNKKCRRCHQWKPLTEFHSNRKSCLPCLEIKRLKREKNALKKTKRLIKNAKRAAQRAASLNQPKKEKRVLNPNSKNGYTIRNLILIELGFDSYRKYLKSGLWKTIKTRAFYQLGRVCAICKEPAEVIHHRRYTKENLSGTSLEYMIPLCNKCHAGIEFNDGGHKTLQPEAVERRLSKIIGTT